MAKKYCFADSIISAVLLLTGGAEAAHLYGVFPGGSLGSCCVLFGVLGSASLILLAGATVILWRKRRGQEERKPWTRTEGILLILFLILFAAQLWYLSVSGRVYRGGDITLETVGSFLENNGIYRVNPMTGTAYEAGLPNRIKILCLPTLYAMLCRLFSVDAMTLVWRLIPSAALFCCYAAYFCLGKSLFPRDRRRQLGFLAIAAFLIWVGSYRYGMDGFDVLYAGWRGVTWRNVVLIPYMISLCLRKKYCHALLCVLAEACIVWTFYGLGVCLPMAACLALIELVRSKAAGKGDRP